jgi:hypothetical protein
LFTERSTTKGVEMEVGQMYAVTLRYAAGNNRVVERVMRASYLGEGTLGADAGCALFSLRPLAGTQSVPRDQIVNVEPARGLEPMLPRAVR